MISVRPAVMADVEAVRAVVIAAYQQYVPRIGREPGPMRADYHAAVRDGHVWLAMAGGTVVGLVVLVTEPDHLLLGNIAVIPAEQGQGIGTQLMTFVEDEARRHGLTEVRLYTHEAMTENIAYYGRRGYTETHREGEEGLRRAFFRKTLT
jgi:GNAT superfamily N-acetyltransferase